MLNYFDKNDTIVALATPNGTGAIGVIRLSGEKTFEIIEKIFQAKKKKKSIESHSIQLGTFVYNDQIIDEVLISYFKNPTSYTGEDVAEISFHGSIYIQNEILTILTQLGARLAKPGEFTQRAFLNGKLDLAQAESVADLIASENKASRDIALQQLKGGISHEMHQIREQLIHFTALIELELDFAEEDVEFANRKQLTELIANIKTKISQLVTTFEYGNAIKNGIPIALVGKPNAGKSTLLNSLLNENRAIVSSIAGTTRDTIEENVVIDGIQFKLIDTAGLRNAKDEIEQIGIERSKQKMNEAKVVLYLCDYNTTTPDSIITELLQWNLQKDKTIIIVNKSENKSDDKVNALTEKLIINGFKKPIFIIAKEMSLEAQEVLKKELLQTAAIQMVDANSVIITNVRHIEALHNCLTAIMQIEKGIQTNLSGDLLSFHLKDAIQHIGSITGKVDVDKDILGTIFGKFCIGK